MAPIYCMSVLQ